MSSRPISIHLYMAPHVRVMTTSLECSLIMVPTWRSLTRFVSVCRSMLIAAVATVQTWISPKQTHITVCTIVQNCCKGRSNKYRKWPFCRCCPRETPWPIDIKFGRDDYVGHTTQYPKRHINRFRGVTPTKGWNVNGLCFFFIFFYFFVCSLAQLGVKPLDRFWRVTPQNACFRESCIPFGVRTTTSQF